MGGRNVVEKLLKLLEVFFNGKNTVKPAVTTVKKHSKPKKKKSPPTLTLVLDRIWFTGESTIGELKIDGQFECYILEDFDRLSKGGKKVYGQTAIPKGTYDIRLTYSPRFKKKLPLLVNVPGFTGIRIHAGNTAKDTEGCLLPGSTRSQNFVGQSKRAFNKLYTKLERAKQEGKRIIIKVDPI